MFLENIDGHIANVEEDGCTWGIYRTREIEHDCRENVNFMYLLEGHREQAGHPLKKEESTWLSRLLYSVSKSKNSALF